MRAFYIPRRLKFFLLTLLALVILGAGYYRFWFLRLPDRHIPNDPAVFVSPANGKVVAVERWNTDTLAWQKDEGAVQVLTQDVAPAGWLIAIEMDVTNVHYQRAPAAGRLLKNTYTKGRFNNALVKTNRWGLRLENERNDLLLETDDGLRYKVVQVAGLLARRIEDFVEPGQPVAQGEVIGLIKLGSQVGLILPASVKPTVQLGDVVTDGETVVGSL